MKKNVQKTAVYLWAKLKLAKAATFSILFTLPFITQAINYSGTYTVGASGTWNNLTSAFAALSAGTVTGNINLVLATGYPAAAETYPITPSTNNGNYSVTIYPSVSGLSVSSSNTVGTINFSGCSRYIIDGRVNQTGAIDLVLENTNTSGYTLQLINDASYNTMRYCNIKGVNVSSAVVYFNTGLSSGNDYNTIDHCDIHDGATTPLECVFSNGTSGIDSDHNTISNCNIYNFYAANNFAAGIDIETANTDWTITGNSLYQTTARVPTAASGLFSIYISNTGNNFVISNNYIGGSAASCGGSALSFDIGATQANDFYPIDVTAGSSSACTIQNNTIANINFGTKWASTSANSLSFIGIIASTGYINISNNTIGSATGNGSISITYATTSTQAFNIGGILSNAVQGSVSNNGIGSITVTGGKTNKAGSIRAIECDGDLSADFTISNNTIGSASTANSIQYTSGAVTPVSITGIFAATTGSYSTTISSNTIQNITNTTTGNGYLIGIYNAGSSPSLVASNTISSLSNAAPTTGDLYGIYAGNTTAGQSIAANIIHDISHTYTGGTAVDVYGIYYAGPTSGTNSISGNTLYKLNLGGSNVSSIIRGIYIVSGIANTYNNMITLGYGLTTGYGMYGLQTLSSTSGNNIYYNSVYLGGAVSSGGNITTAFLSSTTAAKTLNNNIFYNGRTGGSSNHYAITVSSTTGLTSNYNDLYSAVAANLGSYNNGATARSFSAWQSAIGEAGSLNVDPSFISPSSAIPDLHINSSSPVVTKGTSVATVLTDFDDDLRSSTPDMGADEYHTTYYSKSSGNLELTSSWGLNTDGSGTNPPNFTTRNCNFNIRNNSAPAIGAAWTVSGSGSLVILGDGSSACNFTIPAAYSTTGTLSIANNGTLTNQNTVSPTFNVLKPGSTVNYNSASGISQTVANAAYGNLILSNLSAAGASNKSLSSNITIAGNFSINAYVNFDMAGYTANRTGGGGTLSLAANSLLKLSGNTGGASTANNFPNNFSVSLNASSTVEYYGATQSVFPIPSYGNLTITTSGTKTAGGGLTIAGNLTINSGATFAGSTYAHTIGGNWANGGAFTSNSSTVTLSGSATQTVSGTASTFYNLTVNSSAVTLATPVNVSNALGLAAGLLNTDNTNILTMQSGSTAPALTSASASYVNGPMIYQKATAATQTLNFPIGNFPDCRPMALSVTHSTTASYNYKATLYNGNAWSAFGSISTDLPNTCDTISGVHYWTIDRSATATGIVQPLLDLTGNQQIQLYFGTNDGVYQGSALTIVKNTAVTPATWIDIGGTSSLGNFSAPQAGSVTSTSLPNAFTSFSSFTLGSRIIGWNPLPIELVYFKAQPVDTKVELNWQTSTETNNAYFTIERSTDGVNFTKLLDKAGAGNSRMNKDYTAYDYAPYNGKSYYRLKQTDYNGKYKYYPMQGVDFQQKQIINPYPNPLVGGQTLRIELNGYEKQEVSVSVRDIMGREIMKQLVKPENNNTSMELAETASLTAGSYIVVISSGGKTVSKQLIVQ